LIEYRALLIDFRALLIDFRALWMEHRALLTGYRALSAKDRAYSVFYLTVCFITYIIYLLKKKRKKKQVTCGYHWPLEDWMTSGMCVYVFNREGRGREGAGVCVKQCVAAFCSVLQGGEVGGQVTFVCRSVKIK